MRERLAAVRILVGLYATIYFALQLGELVGLARLPAAQFDPVGPIAILGAPLPPAVAIAIAIVNVGLAAAFTLGLAYRVVAPLAAITALFVTAYRSSWGMVFHTDNLLVLHMFALAFAPAADAWAPARSATARDDHAWPLRLCAALTAATYVLAAIAKLRLAGWAWIDGTTLRDQVAIDNVRKVLLGDSVAPLARSVLGHPGAFVAFAIATLVVELGAPILVIGEFSRWGARLAKVWVVGAWSFHLGVVLVMNVWFPYPLSLVPFVVVFRPERGVAWVIRRVRGM